jgi:hypothetical protein
LVHVGAAVVALADGLAVALADDCGNGVGSYQGRRAGGQRRHGERGERGERRRDWALGAHDKFAHTSGRAVCR